MPIESLHSANSMRDFLSDQRLKEELEKKAQASKDALSKKRQKE